MTTENPLEQFLDIARQIEDLVWEHDISYVEAALMLAEKLDMEEDNIGTLILGCPSILEKIALEAEALHFLPKEPRVVFDKE